MTIKSAFSFLVNFIALMVIPFSFTAHGSQMEYAGIKMRVDAEIPELIRIGGLPETVDLKVQADGTVHSDLLKFHILRNGASAGDGKGFLLKVKSSEGQKRRRYYLANKEAKQKMFIRVGLGDSKASTIDDLDIVPAAGIKGYTHAGFDSDKATHTLALFNRNTKYLESRAPGNYSAHFTVTVQAR